MFLSLGGGEEYETKKQRMAGGDQFCADASDAKSKGTWFAVAGNMVSWGLGALLMTIMPI